MTDRELSLVALDAAVEGYRAVERAVTDRLGPRVAELYWRRALPRAAWASVDVGDRCVPAVTA